MAKILAIGIATLDIINTVDGYPNENTETRALSQQQTRGGNASNTLTVLSQLDHDCFFAGILIDEPDGQLIQQDLAACNINTSTSKHLAKGKMPTSYISHNQRTGSRTIVHHRDCPEYSFADFKEIDFSSFDWIHFEGRNVAETVLMFNWLDTHYPQLTYSVEIEKPRPDIELLFDGPDLLLFSQHYAEAQGYNSASSLLQSLPPNMTATCAWGEHGAWAKNNADIIHSPAYPPETIVDTLGAGDTFNAGLISALIQQNRFELALIQACQLAGKKCGQTGLKNLISF